MPNTNERVPRDVMRTVKFSPYRKGMGPTFTLRLFYLGGEWIGYELKQHLDGQTTVLFAGDDFRLSPLHSVDGNDAVVAIMGFLTLRKGDTDADYFDKYTPAQIEFSESFAEALHGEVDARFCDENGNVQHAS